MNISLGITTAKAPRFDTRLGVLFLTGLVSVSSGCHFVSSARHAVPANRLDPALIGCSKEGVAPLPFAALGQAKPNEHIVDRGDTLSIYVFGVFPANEDETPVQQRGQAVNQQYYPPRGAEIGAAAGLPVRVGDNGTIDLPLVSPVPVAGLSVPEATQKVLDAYMDKKVLQKGRERVTINLLNPRVKRVVVLREDTPAPGVSLVQPGANDTIHRGSGQVIDLPIYENDVLHALASSGGLPGTDSKRELWVIRNLPDAERRFIDMKSLSTLSEIVNIDGTRPQATRIPLVGCPGMPIPFTTEDVKLEDGDVVFVPRRNEYFVTGGLLPGARIALPRDEDIDVLEAIALATGSVGGPLGQSGSVLSSGNVGAMREPTRVLVLRKLPDGRQLPIRVDLDRAIQDEKERILIQPEDVVMLQFKPGSAAVVSTLNYMPSSVVFRPFFTNN
jgi:protein involved in polysaccharide export with SLBB domain